MSDKNIYWTTLVPESVSITIHAVSEIDEDGSEITLYASELVYVLDDETDENGVLKNVICLATNIVSECQHCAITETFNSIQDLYSNIINAEVIVLDDDGKIIEELDLNTFFEKDHDTIITDEIIDISNKILG